MKKILWEEEEKQMRMHKKIQTNKLQKQTKERIIILKKKQREGCKR
jgi:hypothetical protein